MSLTVVSLSALRERSPEALQSLRTALSTAGFLHLVDHGIDTEIAATLAAARGFFALPEASKAKAEHPRKGYIPLNGCTNAVRPPHLHEKFSCGRLEESLVLEDPYYSGSSADAQLYFGEPNKWPDEGDVAGFQATYEAAYRALEGLSRDLHSAIAAALGLPEDFFERALQRHVTNLCALHYPQRPGPPPGDPGSGPSEAAGREPGSPHGLPEAAGREPGSPHGLPKAAGREPGSPHGLPEAAGREPGLPEAAGGRGDPSEERVHPHTDPTSLTVLAHDGGDAEGLQVLGAEGRWAEVGRLPGALVVNVGDVLQYWTNGELRSARHRVVGASWRERLSLVFFCMPGYDTRVEAPPALLRGRAARYPAFVCGERSHFAQQLRDAEGLPDRQLLSNQPPHH